MPRGLGLTHDLRFGYAGGGAAAPPPVDVIPGWGAGTTGGVGGKVIEVTTLDSHGPGSLGEALDTLGPRIVVPAANLPAGDIVVTGQLLVTEENCTLSWAGGPDIRQDGFQERSLLQVDASNVIIEDVRIRQSPSNISTFGLGCFRIEGPGISYIVIRRCSAAFAVDKALTINDNVIYVTFYNNILAYTLYDSNHMEGVHSRGITISSKENGNPTTRISMIDNLVVSHNFRYPNVSTAEAEVINNLLVCDEPHDLACNTGDKWPGQYPSGLDFRGNHCRFNLPVGGGVINSPNAQTLVDGLVHESNNISNVQMFDDTFQLSTSGIPRFSSGYEPINRNLVYNYVRANAGVRPLDNIDQDIMDRIADETTIIIDQEGDLGFKMDPNKILGVRCLQWWDAQKEGSDPSRCTNHGTLFEGAHGSQNTPENQPVLVPDAGDGKAAWTFDGTQFFLSGPMDLPATIPYYVWAVYRFAEVHATNAALIGDGNASFHVYLSGGQDRLTLRCGENLLSNVAQAVNTWHASYFMVDGVNSEIEPVAGTPNDTGDAGAGVPARVGIGSQSNGATPYIGDLRCIVMAYGTLTAKQINDMSTWARLQAA